MPGVRGRRWLVILAVLVGLVGLYAAVGFLLVPRWMRSELVQLTARDFGRTLSIGDVSFNPFTWTLDIADFSLPDADGRPMISFGRLEVAVGHLERAASRAEPERHRARQPPRQRGGAA